MTAMPPQLKSGDVMLLGAIWISAFLVSLDYSAVTVALPTIAGRFGVGTSLVSWVSISYMLVTISLLLLCGPFIRRIGYQRALFLGLTLFAIGAAASAFAPSLWVLILMRALQGFGATIMVVIGPALIKTSLLPDRHTRSFAIYSTAPMAGLLVGPALGGELVYLFGWQSVFFIVLPFCAVALLLSRSIDGAAGIYTEKTMESSPPPVANPGLVILAVISLVALVVALNQGYEWGWTSPPILSLIAVGVIVGTACAVLNNRATVPLVDRRILAATDYVPACLILFLILLVFGGFVFLLPFYFQWLRNFGTGTVGAILATQPLATIAVSVLAGYLLANVERRTLCFAGLSLCVLGIVVFAVTPYTALILLPIGGLVLIGAGMGLYFPVLMQMSMAKVPSELAASASSLQAALRIMAQMLGVVIFETVFSQLYPEALNAKQADSATGAQLDLMQTAFHATFWFSLLLAVLAVFYSLRLSRAPRSVPDAVAEETAP